MSNYLTTLRNKPKHVRNNIALLAAGVSVVPIFLFAIFGLHGTTIKGGLAEGADSPKFFETLFGEFKEQMATARESMPKSEPAPTASSTEQRDLSHLKSTPVIEATSSASTTAATSGRSIRIATTTATTTLDVLY